VLVLVLASIFIGYLLFDAWQARQRNKRIQRLVQEAKKRG
jgi:Tfp pilus assembly protein PilN